MSTALVVADDAAPTVNPPVPMKKTVMLVNNFIIHTTQFLNHFSSLAEERLMNIHANIVGLEENLALLESRLNRMPELNHITAPAAPGTTTASIGNAAAPAAAPAAANAPPPPTTAAPAAPAPDAPPPPPPAEEAPPPPAEPAGVPASQHPTYKKFFKLLNIGAPRARVELNMRNDGLDPSILDTPNKIIADDDDAGGDAPPPPPAPAPAPAPAAAAPPPPPAEAEPAPSGGGGGLTVRDDPQYAKWFKMLKMGIPPHAVKNKMIMSGDDPSLIDNPDAPSPNAGAIVLADDE